MAGPCPELRVFNPASQSGLRPRVTSSYKIASISRHRASPTLWEPSGAWIRARVSALSALAPMPAPTRHPQVQCPAFPLRVALIPTSSQTLLCGWELSATPRAQLCGKGINNFEIGILKATSLAERARLEFRAELFNMFNHAQFFVPDGNITNGNDFGRVKRARDPRLVQFALKLFF